MRILSRTAVAVVALASFLVPVPPAQAAGGGGLVFEGDVTLPVFPCTPNCGATGTPNEAAPLVFTADISVGTLGFSDGAVGIVTGLSASVKYSEPPCIAGEAVTGDAAGTAIGSGTLRGANVVGTALPMTAEFSWLRVGLVAVITLVSPDDVITGAAVFIPTGGAPSCTGGPMTATVAGAATEGSPSKHGKPVHDVRAELTVRPGILPGSVTFELKNSDPLPDRWTCAVEGYTVTCQPEALSRNTRYRCIVVEATVSHVGVGPMSGTSACAGGAATGVSPDQPHAESSPAGEVPFSCSLSPNAAAVTWEVFCKVRPG